MEVAYIAVPMIQAVPVHLADHGGDTLDKRRSKRERRGIGNPVRAEALEIHRVCELFRDNEGSPPGRIRALRSVCYRRHGLDPDLPQNVQGSPFIFRAENGTLKLHQVLDDFDPAYTAMNLEEIGTAVEGETQRGSAQHLAQNLSLELLDLHKRVELAPKSIESFIQVQVHVLVTVFLDYYWILLITNSFVCPS
jgi:hypothetical protein